MSGRPRRTVRAGLGQRAHGHDREAVARQPERLLVVRRVRPGVGEDQPRQAEGDFVHRPDGGGFGAAAAHQPAVARERVQQGDQRVEDKRSVTEGREEPPERHQEVARVPDDDRVDREIAAVLREQPHMRRRDPGGEPRGAPPTRHLGRGHARQRGLELEDLDAVLAETRDEHGVAGIVRLVRPEVRDGPGHG